jgi:hypothetical protein
LLATVTHVAWLASLSPTTDGVTIRNDVPRVDTGGNIVDAHSGNVVGPVNGTYYFYGERYRNATGMDWKWVEGGYAPKLTVYTSKDLVTWVDRGLCLPETLNESQWCPSVM